MIRLEHARKTYPGFQLDCSMEVKEGQITALIGANGAGKSTTFKLILGLIRPESGEVTVFGHAVEELTAKKHQQIGVVLSDAGFSEYLTIKDLLPILESLYPAFERSGSSITASDFLFPAVKRSKNSPRV